MNRISNQRSQPDGNSPSGCLYVPFFVLFLHYDNVIKKGGIDHGSILESFV